MHENELNETRSSVITRAIAIESMIVYIISQNYFGKINEHFVYEVLFDEMFTFALKRNVLRKIVPDLDKSGFFEKINRIMKIRNAFAHSNIRVVTAIDDLPKLIFVNPQDFAKGFTGDYGKGIDFKKMSDEFNRLYEDIKEYLHQVAKHKGLIFQ